MRKIEAVIFDWAGTTVDYGCFAPVGAFAEAFMDFGIEPTTEEIRQPMGMLKIDHIRTMMKMPRIKNAWKSVHGDVFNEEDIHRIYNSFETHLLKSLKKYAEPKPYVLEVTKELRNMGIKIGSTTGYTNSMMDIVAPAAKKLGYAPDFCITPELVGGFGRPYPYMIFENIKLSGVSDVKNVIKIGDTQSDIKEGKNSGVWSAGVLEGSSEAGLSMQEFNALNSSGKQILLEKARRSFNDAGADFVINNLSELPELIIKIESGF